MQDWAQREALNFNHGHGRGVSDFWKQALKYLNQKKKKILAINDGITTTNMPKD